MRRRCGRTPGRRPVKLSPHERAAIHCVFANPRQPNATIAVAVGLKPAELSRIRRLKAGRELFDLLQWDSSPEELWPDYQVTGPGSIPPAVDKMVELEKLVELERAKLEGCFGPSNDSGDEVLRQLGFGPRKPKDGTDA